MAVVITCHVEMTLTRGDDIATWRWHWHD